MNHHSERSNTVARSNVYWRKLDISCDKDGIAYVSKKENTSLDLKHADDLKYIRHIRGWHNIKRLVRSIRPMDRDSEVRAFVEDSPLVNDDSTQFGFTHDQRRDVARAGQSARQAGTGDYDWDWDARDGTNDLAASTDGGWAVRIIWRFIGFGESRLRQKFGKGGQLAATAHEGQSKKGPCWHQASDGRIVWGIPSARCEPWEAISGHDGKSFEFRSDVHTFHQVNTEQE